jgi:hypothetical protein
VEAASPAVEHVLDGVRVCAGQCEQHSVSILSHLGSSRDDALVAPRLRLPEPQCRRPRRIFHGARVTACRWQHEGLAGGPRRRRARGRWGGATERRWSSLVPKLLADILRRVDVGAERWPGQRNVVACACVCRRWPAPGAPPRPPPGNATCAGPGSPPCASSSIAIATTSGHSRGTHDVRRRMRRAPRRGGVLPQRGGPLILRVRFGPTASSSQLRWPWRVGTRRGWMWGPVGVNRRLAASSLSSPLWPHRRYHLV